jgi:hypothetical protein
MEYKMAIQLDREVEKKLKAIKVYLKKNRMDYTNNGAISICIEEMYKMVNKNMDLN